MAISGDGNVIVQKRIVSDFRNLTINGPFKLVFSDDPHSDFFVKVETDRNLQDVITVTQLNSIDVYVNIKPGVTIEKYTKLILYIDNGQINSLTINANTDQASDIVLPIHCYDTHLKITGSIPVSIFTKVSCHPVSFIKGENYDKINHAKLIAEIDNMRTTRLRGVLDEVVIVNSGSGGVLAFDLSTYIMRMRNTSNAASEIYSYNSFEIINRGEGHIYYKGEGTLTELKEISAGSICREEYTDGDRHELMPIETKSDTIGVGKIAFNTDSLFQLMLDRDQIHRRVKKGDTMHTIQDDTDNFLCLNWFLGKYGYPEISSSTLRAMMPTLFIHIDNYERFMAINKYLLKAVKEGKLLPNTYAYSYDRSMISAGLRPGYYYFIPGSEWYDLYKPSLSELPEVNKHRKEIGLPDYPMLLNGKYF
jgi:hypothetical protein